MTLAERELAEEKLAEEKWAERKLGECKKAKAIIRLPIGLFSGLKRQLG
jgi:hypothetical protein